MIYSDPNINNISSRTEILSLHGLVFLATVRGLFLFKVVTINQITPIFTHGRTGQDGHHPKKAGAVCIALYIRELQGLDRKTPNFPISTYRNTINENSQIYFQPKTRCHPAMRYIKALKVLKTLICSRTGSDASVLPCPAMKKINL
jgi:hypothetical protein